MAWKAGCYGWIITDKAVKNRPHHVQPLLWVPLVVSPGHCYVITPFKMVFRSNMECLGIFQRSRWYYRWCLFYNQNYERRSCLLKHEKYDNQRPVLIVRRGLCRFICRFLCHHGDVCLRYSKVWHLFFTNRGGLYGSVHRLYDFSNSVYYDRRSDAPRMWFTKLDSRFVADELVEG
jgi:hypothetical protein